MPFNDDSITLAENKYIGGGSVEKDNENYNIYYFTPTKNCTLYVVETSSIYDPFYNAYKFVAGVATYITTFPSRVENKITLDANAKIGLSVKKGTTFNYIVEYQDNYNWALTDEIFENIRKRLKSVNMYEWLACGDSLTAGGLYTGFINDDERFNITNIGVDGMSWISHYSVVKGTNTDYPLPSDFDWNKYDIITIMLGTNYQFNGATCDFSKLDGNYENYTDQSKYPDMFVYHCCAYLEYVMEHKREDALLFVLCPPKWTNLGSGSEEVQNAYHTELKRILAWYSIPCIDVNENCYINRVNAGKYLRDTLHPNELGAKKIADAIISSVSPWLQHD